MGKLYLPAPLTAASSTMTTVDALAPTWSVTDSSALHGAALLKQLRDFVAEVLQLIESLPLPSANDDDPSLHARQLAEEACERVSRMISARTLDLSHSTSSTARGATDELRYLMAALADELLLSRDWPGRSRFTETLIETRLFGSSVAGDVIFQRIDAQLAGKADVSPAMAPLYLFAISVGFEGRHRGLKADEALQPLKDDLFRLIYRRDAQLGSKLADQIDAGDRVLSPQAYRYPLSNIVPVRFFRFSRGVLAFIGTMLLLLVLSQVAWRWTTAPVRKALEPSAPTPVKQVVPSEAERG
ncbi:MAG: DotU family type IV/VI secretion system protein [Betaproteobacteria bacterium]